MFGAGGEGVTPPFVGGQTGSQGAGAAPWLYAASARIAASTPSGVSGNMRCWKISAIITVDCEWLQ